jgi:DNA-binding LacI/PurR family transcriptional regulator
VSRPVSIRDIARQAEVSHTTVSRALHNSPLISKHVRERIQGLARELGYVPNAVAQSLKQSQTFTVGLVVTSIADPFVGRVVRGIDEVARDAHLGVILSVSNNEPEQEIAVIEAFNRRRVDGIIIAASRLEAAWLQRAAGQDVPLVLINPQCEAAPNDLPTVSIDDWDGAGRAVRHLLELGHRRIGFIGAGNRPRSNRLRLEAYRAALCEAGIQPLPEWVQIASPARRYYADDVADGEALLPALLESGVSAVFCYNDSLALGALHACRLLGVAVPGRLSIAGFDDIDVSRYLHPALTTVHQPKLRLGQTAMRMLLALRSGEAAEDCTFETNLMPRESTARPDR